ncbi:MAG: HAMP domain-containing sensor histidine kinase [Candidatus Shapirobacteria bacterium]|nr:HAMP domain-containing sensor histidine kinase [Candidatus Shapirobacteria bacterium]
MNLQWKLSFLFLLNLGITIIFINFVTKYAINQHFYQFCQLAESGIPKCLQSQAGLQFMASINSSLWVVSIFGSLLALFLGYLFSRSFLKPFQNIITSTKQVSKGDYKIRIKAKTYDETDELIVALNEMYGSLERIETLRKELVANMSHELSTPLTNIYGYLEALSDQVITKKHDRKTALKLIKSETERLIQLIGELKKLAILESDSAQLSLSKIDINQLIKKTTQSFTNKLKDKKILLKTSFDDQIGKISVDKNKIQQVITNLLDNAIKYSAPQGAITLTTKKINNRQLNIIIKDQGIGIKKSDLPYIFERFFQADRSRSNKVGIGIGLTIVQKIVTAHGGQVKVSSIYKKGSTFIVTLPILS